MFVVIRSALVAVLIVLQITYAGAQPIRFSLATDATLEHSFKQGQRYWAIGQTVVFHFHLTPKDGVYAWLSYYSDGKFRNDLVATAKQPATTPQTIGFANTASLRFKHISLGWRKYLKGSFDAVKGWNMYSYAGFGLMIGRIQNSQSVNIDSSQYFIPVRNGKGNFKRLTFDLGLGTEFPLGGDVDLYFEARTLIPTSDYPSPYLLLNRKAPLTAAVNGGVRILIN